MYIFSEEHFYKLRNRNVKDKILVLFLEKKHNKLTFKSWMKKLYIIYYDHELDNLLEGLEYLDIDKKVNRKLRNLPNSLKYLSIRNYNFPIDNLPNNLEELHLCNCHHPLDKIPKTVKKLTINNNDYLDTIPDNIEYLEISGLYDKCQITKYPLKLNYLVLGGLTQNLDNLPNTLYGLKLNNYTLPIDNLPINIEKLELTYYRGQIDFLPINLKILHLCKCSEINSFENLPENLEVLSIVKYDKEIKMLPDNLKVLYIYGYSPKKIYFPKNLQELNLTSYTYERDSDYEYNYDIELEGLPVSLKKITLYENHKTKEILRNIRKKFDNRIEMYVEIENKPLKVGEEYFID